MRIRALRLIASGFGVFPPGVVVDVPAEVGKDWCNAGMAMQDKSLDGGKETKTEPKVSSKRKRKKTGAGRRSRLST